MRTERAITEKAPTTCADPAGSPPPATLLRLIWLASPALPVGGYSYSEGLESAVDAAIVTDEPSAARWLLDQLRLSLARSEMPLVASAWRAWRDADLRRVEELNAWHAATRESSELRLQAAQMGRSLAAWLRQHGDADERIAFLLALQPAPAWPVAFALAAWRSGASLLDSLLAFGFSWAENQVQAALKTVPLGQSAGQRVLAALVADLPAVAERAAAMHDDERVSFAPRLAILSAQHETQYSRLFRS